MFWNRSPYPKLYKIWKKVRGKIAFVKNISAPPLTMVCVCVCVYENVCYIRILDVMLYVRLNKVHCLKTTDALRTEATWIEIHMNFHIHTSGAEWKNWKQNEEPEQKCSGNNNNNNNKIVPTNELVCWRNGEKDEWIQKKIWETYQPTMNNKRTTNG